MPCPPRPRRRLLPAILLPALSACFRPSYSQDRLAEHVQDICRREYKMDVAARFVGGTLYVRHVLDDLVGENLELKPKKLDALDNLLRVTNRVGQSTDAKVEHLVLQLQDRRLGTRLDLLQRFEDYEKLRNVRISQEEFQSRLAIEWVKGGAPEPAEHGLTLAEFMARLTAARLHRNMTGNPFVSVLLGVQSVTGAVEGQSLVLTAHGGADEPEKISADVLINAAADAAREVCQKYDPAHALIVRVRLQNPRGKRLWQSDLVVLERDKEKSAAADADPFGEVPTPVKSSSSRGRPGL
jgi:hypothetical protein